MELTRDQVRELAEYMAGVVDEIPAGATSLKDAVSFALFELNCYAFRGVKLDTYVKALAFAQSIPRVDDLDSDELVSWMIHDREHLKYMP